MLSLPNEFIIISESFRKLFSASVWGWAQISFRRRPSRRSMEKLVTVDVVMLFEGWINILDAYLQLRLIGTFNTSLNRLAGLNVACFFRHRLPAVVVALYRAIM